MDESTKWFSLKTRKGSARLLVLFMALVLVFSFLAQLVTSNGFKVSVTDVTIEVRGADLTMEVYKPANVDSSYSLPCMILAHGGSESLSACSLVAWEFARRGFVVLNVNAYGAGESDMPAINEEGLTSENYFRGSTNGYYDALEYARTLTYVDKTRIGMWGHSAGYLLESTAMLVDGEYFTMNDRMLNVLFDTFKVQISEEQLTQNADDIAAAELSKDQLTLYNYLKTEQQGIFDSYVKAARISASFFGKTVIVAGHEVVRDPQSNLMVGLGTHENPAAYYVGTTDQYKAAFHTGTEEVTRNSWYDTCDYTIDVAANSSAIGQLFDTSVLSSAELKSAVENRTARLLYSPETFHSGNEWFPSGISRTLEFFTQTLGYDNGELSDGATQPISSNSFTCYWALTFTTLAFLSMLGMLIALCAILLKTKYFAPCAKECYEPTLTTKDSKFWIFAAAAVAAGFAGTYVGTLENLGFQLSNKLMTKWLPFEPGQMRMFMIIISTALAGIIVYAILSAIYGKKKDTRLATLADLKISAGWSPVLKTFLLGAILLAVGYFSAIIINSLFDQRYVILDGSFDLMKPYGFMRLLKYAIILLPFTLVVSAMNNLTIVKNVSDTTDTIISVVVNSLGAYVLIAIGLILTYSTKDHGVVFALHGILALIPLIPIVNYLYRKLFKMTGSVWAGAIVVALLMGWRLASYISHMFMYIGPNEIRAFWGM